MSAYDHDPTLNPEVTLTFGESEFLPKNFLPCMSPDRHTSSSSSIYSWVSEQSVHSAPDYHSDNTSEMASNEACDAYNWPGYDEDSLQAYNLALERFNQFCKETHTTPDYFFEKHEKLPRRRTSYSFTAFASDIEALADHLEGIYEAQSIPNSQQCIQYLTWQEERCPSTGTHHLQGFIKLVGRHQMTYVKDSILKLKDAPVPVSMYMFFHKDDQKAIKYVMKPFSRVSGGNHGDCGQYKDRDDTFKSAIQERASKQSQARIEIVTKLSQELSKDEGNILVLMEYPDFLPSFQSLWDTSRAMRRIAAQKERTEAAKQMTLRPWQQNLYEEIQTLDDDRKIIVYADVDGGAGKTTFIRYMTDMHPNDAVYMENVKANDAKHTISKHEHPKYVLINLTRTVNDKVGYQVYESIKDGQFTSGKYDSRNVRIKSPVMVFFTNEHLDYDAMSRDRWDVRELVHNPILNEYNVTTYKTIDSVPIKRRKLDV